MLSKFDTLQPYFLNPVNNTKIYILFDSVHILKCIRNNWLNVKSDHKTFSFPDIDNIKIIHRASFTTLDRLYEMEKGATIKKAYTLNYKSIHPHSIERQNVKLALRIFHENNAAALRTLGTHNDILINWEGTAVFIDYILKFWHIFNVKTPVEGIHKRLPDCYPIRSVNDQQIIWLQKFVSWLDSWKRYSVTHPHSFLTKETFIAVSHTVKTVLFMIPDLFQRHHLKYVLLAKFQTDNLEGRFGLYRQLSGCNYLVSVKDIIHSERKLKIKGLLRLFTASKDGLTVSNYLSTFSDIEKHNQDEEFIDDFPYCDMDTEIKDVSELLMVTGFVAKRTITHLTCKACKSKIGCVGKPMHLFVDEKSNQYFDLINRGGLTYPSNILFTVMQFAYLIFNLCISTLETPFLKLHHQKQTFLGVVERFIVENEDCQDVNTPCEECGDILLVVIMKALSCFANTLLNNYSKDKKKILSHPRFRGNYRSLIDIYYILPYII